MIILMLFALFVTILVESVVAMLLGYRKKLEIATIILINLITNPLMNYLIIIGVFLAPSDRVSTIITTLFLEIVVVFVEWLLLRFALRSDSKKLFVLSLVMNVCSFIAGFIIIVFLSLINS